MLTSSTRQRLKKKLIQYEGNIPHMYLDANGFVTVGVGHLIGSAEDAEKLPFVKESTTKDATDKEIRDDFLNVQKQEEGWLASYYKRYTSLILRDTDIDALTNAHIRSFYKELKKLYPDFDSFPGNAKLALFDMIFNLGMTNLKNRWPNFNKYIRRRDWQKAATESKRKPPYLASTILAGPASIKLAG